MEKHEIQGQPRTVTGKKVKKIRSKGLTPGNVFGKNIKSVSVQIETKPFMKIFSQIGESTLAYLKVSGEKEDRPVFITNLAKDHVTGLLLHVTFHQVDLKEKVTAPVPIKLLGEASAEKEKLGIMVQQLDELEVEALPTDMPEHIEIDISGLAEVGSHITVSDLKLDASKLTVKTDPSTIVVQIEALAKEEIVATPTVAVGEVGPVPAEGEATGAVPTTAASETPPKPEAKPKAEK
jgi:large subunit ribosomal protein L25